jgi:hypothetical protein
LIPLVISPGTGVKGTDNTLLQFYYFIWNNEQVC